MSCQVRTASSSFRGYLNRTEVTSSLVTADVLEYFETCRASLRSVLSDRLTELRGLKFWLCLGVTYYRSTDVGETISCYFPNTTQTILNEHEIDPCLEESFVKITAEVEKFEERGSNWVVESIHGVDLYTVGYTPFVASSYVLLPQHLSSKRAIVNVKNNDNRCFMWSVLSALHPARTNIERTSNYRQFVNTLDFSGISFPVKLQDIPKFTEKNQISINVFAFDEENKSIFPVYRCKQRLSAHVNLFVYKDHYMHIRHFDRLMGDQTAHNGKGYYCDMCLFPMYSLKRLNEHDCDTKSLSAVNMPNDNDKTLKFTNIHKMLRKPLVVYADFEAILNPYHCCDPNPLTPYTSKYQEHIPCSFGMVSSKSCCSTPTFNNLLIQTTADPAKAFIEKLVEITEEHARTANSCQLQMSPAEEAAFLEQEKCLICDEALVDDRVRDHCHVCGSYRGALHSKCNQMLRLDKEVVVIMHNMKRYDTHIIMQSIGKACVELNLSMSCVAKGMENYVTFSVSHGRDWRIRFVDSAQFLPASLEQLAKQLTPDQLKCMQTYFNDQEIALFGRKGVFPYDYLDSWGKMNLQHPIQQQHFYNKLTDSHISDEDYQHYLSVCDLMKPATLQDYLETYLKVDVMLLADVFEQFRKFSLENYKLDPCHYSTLPGLGWDSALKMTNVELDLLTDPEMYTFFEKGIRGGISVISKRHARSNNSYMSTHLPDREQSFILYYDANNLYGWSMGEPLPQKDFRWLTQHEIDNLDITKVDPYGDDGYVLEVDLEYPPSLHDSHNAYPLAPEQLDITEDMLSPYCKRIAQKHGMKVKTVPKLCPNLRNKQKYIVHYRNLQFYLEQGLILKKIHRVITFKQDTWMAPYINFNTQKRREATTEFQKNLYKFFVNSVFGKTMENVRKYKTVELVTNERRMRKLTKKPNFQRAVIFNENLTGCSVGRTVITLNKPIYIGFTVLDVSKLLMYRFHYEYINAMYKEDAQLLMTDTDSLMYLIVTDRDVYVDMLNNSHLFDTSDYPVGHFLKSDVNKKVVGKMKDELNGKAADAFVGLRSKMYSLKCGDDEKKRAKGVKRRVVTDQITHQDYYTILEDQSYTYHPMRLIRSDRHRLFSVQLNKKSLSCYDDKRFILDDGINSLAYGHYRIDTEYLL